MDQNDFEVGAFFTNDGESIWKMKSFVSEPSCTLINIETEEQKTFGVGGLTARDFHRILMPAEAMLKKKDLS